MTIGRNPHVARAKVAEQKAELAGEGSSRAQAYRDAAHQWDRASEREKPGKMRAEYEANALRNRALADGGPAATDDFEALPGLLAAENADGHEDVDVDPLSLN